MEIFTYNIKFKSFGEIYVGLSFDFITVNDVIQFGLSKNLLPCNEEKLVELILDEKGSKYEFLNRIEEYVHQENALENHQKLENNIPKEFFRIWKLEFLLRATSLEKGNDKILEKVYEYFY